ncbi:hypothetical protein N0V86_005412 [Didymella sp. IMI 355093]|nr:hypothetical protein N0V86_005412 [Didymella sp. IMI 355093]
MASVPAIQRPAFPMVPDVNDSPEPPSSKSLPPESTLDTPSGFPNTISASENTETSPANVISEIPHTSATAAEDDTNVKDGEVVEYEQTTTSIADSAANTVCAGTYELFTIERGEVDAKAGDLQVSAAEDKTRGDESEKLTSSNTEALPAATQDSSVASEAKSSDEEEEGSHRIRDEMQISNVRGKGSIAEDSEESPLGDDEDTAEFQKPAKAGATPSRSVPPHMRPAFKAPNTQQSSILDTRVGHFSIIKQDHTNGHQPHWPVPVPRTPRGYYLPVGHQSSHPPLDYDELQRTKVQLMKARSDLHYERKINVEMRKTVEVEKQASIGSAMADMLNDLLQKQAGALNAKARMQEKERDLEYREQKITQLETYLANGQKQLKWQLEEQGIRAMSQVDEANLRREVELQMKHQLSEIEGKIGIQVERLRYQEAAQKIREQQYRVLIRDALENEVREELARDMQGKISDTEVTEAAYERGIAEGKRSGGSKSSEDEHKQEFFKGYAACYRTLTILHNVRNGKIAVESSDVAVLFDPTHPENPHNVGLHIGCMEAPPTKVKTSVGVVVNRKSMEKGAARTAAIQSDFKSSADAVTDCDRGQALFDEAGPSRSSQKVIGPEQARLVQQVLPTQSREAQQTQQAQQEQPILSRVPPHSTFAGELRGSSSGVATPNGSFLGRSNPQASSNAARVGTVSRMGEGVYAGRRTIRYEEDSEDDPSARNLIDLY